MKELTKGIMELDDDELDEVSAGIENESCFVYQIKPGDCLSVIAQRYKTTVRELCRINGINNPNVLDGYTTLLIPYSFQ